MIDFFFVLAILDGLHEYKNEFVGWKSWFMIKILSKVLIQSWNSTSNFSTHISCNFLVVCKNETALSLLKHFGRQKTFLKKMEIQTARDKRRLDISRISVKFPKTMQHPKNELLKHSNSPNSPEMPFLTTIRGHFLGTCHIYRVDLHPLWMGGHVPAWT